MEEFRKILRDAINVLKRKPKDDNIGFQVLDSAYNKALEDVIEQVINKIPN